MMGFLLPSQRARLAGTALALRAKSLIAYLIFLSLLFGANIDIAEAQAKGSDPDRPGADFLCEYMQAKGLNGTMVLESLKSGKRYVYDKKRSAQEFLPASTFKILNSLIALELGVLQDASQTIGWDGRDYGLAAWNRDQNLESALASSCVWFFQELARRIGDKKYQDIMQKTGYGNGLRGENLDSFWLDGDLRISALGQIEFLRAFQAQTLPFSKENLNLVKSLLLIKEDAGYRLYAKTGLTLRVPQKLGWYVGFLESSEDVWIFACNLDIRKPGEEDFRQAICRQAFKELGIFPRDYKLLEKPR